MLGAGDAQHYAGLLIAGLMYWACLRLVTTDPVTEERFRGPLPCPDNEIMSRRCLFDVQPNHYAALCKHPRTIPHVPSPACSRFFVR